MVDIAAKLHEEQVSILRARAESAERERDEARSIAASLSEGAEIVARDRERLKAEAALRAQAETRSWEIANSECGAQRERADRAEEALRVAKEGWDATLADSIAWRRLCEVRTEALRVAQGDVERLRKRTHEIADDGNRRLAEATKALTPELIGARLDKERRAEVNAWLKEHGADPRATGGEGDLAGRVLLNSISHDTAVAIHELLRQLRDAEEALRDSESRYSAAAQERDEAINAAWVLREKLSRCEEALRLALTCGCSHAEARAALQDPPSTKEEKPVSETVRAPWNINQIKALNAYQRLGTCHPFTCGDCGGELVAVESGWLCVAMHCCNYRQDWAHAFMADWAWVSERQGVDWKMCMEPIPSDSTSPPAAEPRKGLWRCSGCGEALEATRLADTSWRWTGERYEHKCPGNHPQHGHEPAEWFGEPQGSPLQKGEKKPSLPAPTWGLTGNVKVLPLEPPAPEPETCHERAQTIASDRVWDAQCGNRLPCPLHPKEPR